MVTRNNTASVAFEIIPGRRLVLLFICVMDFENFVSDGEQLNVGVMEHPTQADRLENEHQMISYSFVLLAVSLVR